MNNGVNDTTNQVIPGVKIAPPSDKPVDASTSDVGAAVSKAQSINSVTATPAVQSAQSVPVQVTAAPVASSVPIQPVQPTQVVVSEPSQVVSQESSAVSPQPVSVSTQAVEPSSAPVVVEEVVVNNKNKKREKKPKNKLARFYFFIILLLLLACGGLYYYHQQQMLIMNAKCTPVSTSGEAKKLDLESTIVQDLYSKVKTTIREDLGGVELNDSMKLYLAYRQIPTSKLYESNCNRFSSVSMEPFVCEVKASFVPKAFKISSLDIELKKLFGDDIKIPYQNIQLGNTCVGGFQYIEERKEYVEGQCTSTGATIYRVDKELIEATSTETTIVLIEKVKYYGGESLDLPNKLVSGKYKYTFKLDMNYNYIYLSKELIN